MKNILAENLLRFGVKNLSVTDKKRIVETTLMTEASAPGSYKTQNAEQIITGTFSTYGNELSLTLGGKVVGTWTANSPVNPTIGAFTFKAGPGNAGLYDTNGNLTPDAAGGTATQLLGLDKAAITAAMEVLKTAPADSVWNKPFDAKKPKLTYTVEILSRFRISDKQGISTKGQKDYINLSSTIKFGTKPVRVYVKYTLATKEFQIDADQVQRTAKSAKELIDTVIPNAVKSIWSRQNGQAGMTANVIDPIVQKINGMVDTLNTMVGSI
jgi:hypothetical protein